MGHAAGEPPQSLHLGGLPQLGFQRLVFGYVLDGADGKLGLPGTAPDRGDMHASPDLATILGQVALLHLVAVVALGEQVGQELTAGLDVDRVRVVQDRQPSQLLRVVTKQPPVGRVALNPMSIPVDEEHSERRLVEDRPHPGLAGLKCRFGLLARRDVAGNDLDGGLPVEDDGSGYDLDVEGGSVKLHMPLFYERRRLARAQHAGHPAEDEPSVLRSDEFDDRPTEHLLGRLHAVHPQGRTVGEDEPAVLVDDHRVGQQREQCLEARLRLCDVAGRPMTPGCLVAGRDYETETASPVHEPRGPRDACLSAVLAQPLRPEVHAAHVSGKEPVELLLGLGPQVRAQAHDGPEWPADCLGQWHARRLATPSVPEPEAAVGGGHDDQGLDRVDRPLEHHGLGCRSDGWGRG